MDQNIRFSPEELEKKEYYAKIEVGMCPGSQLFFSGKIDSILSNSPHPIHGPIIRLENMLIGRIVSLMNKEEYLRIKNKKTEEESFLEILLYENIRYEKQIYDNAEDHLSEMNHQSNSFYETIAGINDDEIIEKVRQSTRENQAEIEKRLIETHGQLKKKFDIVEQELTEKLPKPLTLDYDKIDDLLDKISLFEKSCRSFIISTLSKEENWWKQKIPKDVRTYALETKETNEKKINYSKSQGDLINFINLPDIKKIILSNKKDFKSIKNWDEFQVNMDKVGTYRNELFHSRELEIMDKHHLNYCISHILQIFQNSKLQEYVIDTNGYTSIYKKPISENYIPKDLINPENSFELSKHELVMMNATKMGKIYAQNIFYHITKNPKSLLIWFSNYAKKEKIPIIHFECTSRTTVEELVGRRNYTIDSKKDEAMGIEIGAFKLANELSEIHGSAIIFLENFGTINPHIQNVLIRYYIEDGKTDQNLSLIGIKNYQKLTIIATDKSHLMSKKLYDYANFFLDDELK